MSTVRIQVRRGAASDWTSVNPILAAGEVGFETTTNKIKVGDGSTAWSSLSYIASDAPGVGEIAQDAIAQALSMGSGISKAYDDAGNTITLTNTGVLSFNTRTGDIELTSNDVTTALGYTPASVSDLNNFANTASDNISSAIQTAELYTDSSIQNNIAGTSNIDVTQVDSDKIVISLSDNPRITGTVNAGAVTATTVTAEETLNATDVVISGNLTVNGTTTTVNATNFSVSDPLIYIGENNQSDVLDLGFVASFDDGTYQHSGIVRDASDGVWKLFSGVTAEPDTTVDFSTYTKDSIQVGGIDAERAKIGSVTNTEIQYLHGLTSGIQSQLNSKANKSYVDATFPLAINGEISTPTITSPTISGNTIVTGSISLPTDSITSDNIVNGSITSSKILNNTIVNADINASAAIAYSKLALTGSIDSSDLKTGSVTTDKISNGSVTSQKIDSVAISQVTDLSSQLELKATLAGPTFTGIVVLPATTSIGSVSATEIGYIDGVTSSIQTQLDTGTSNLSSHSSATTNVHGISDTSTLATKTYANNAATTAAGTAKTDAEAYTDSEILTEVTNRNSAITNATANMVKTTDTGSVTSGMIADGTIVNSDVNASAAISYSKLNLAGSITSSDIVDGTIVAGDIADGAITSAKILDGTIVNGDISSSAAIAYSKLNLASSITSADIVNGTIVDADINSSAAIAATKIAGTAVTQADTGTVTSAMIADGTIVNGDISSTAAIANSKLANSSVTVNGISIALGASGTVTAAANTLTGSTLTSGVTSSSLTSVGTLTSLAVTGDTTIGGNLTVTGTGTFGGITVNGTTTTINSSNLSVSDSLIYLSNGQFDADALDIGFYGAYGTTGGTVSNHKHTGLTRNHATGEWYLFSNGIEASGQTVDLTTATLDTLKVGTLKGNVTGNVTGSVSGNAGTVTNGVYVTDTGTVTNAMLAGSIANSKLTNSAVTVGTTSISLGSSSTTLAGLTSVTSTGFTGALTGNADTATKLSTPRAINGVNFDGSAAITITAANPNALTIGAGLSGTSYTGSGAVTIAIDSTVATLTGTQTLTNKTLTSPSIATPTITGTLTTSASGITFSDGTVQTVAGTPSITPINPQTASITLGATFVKDSFVKMNVSTANTVTIPTDATYSYPIGASLDFQQAGSGQTSFVAASGVTFEAASINGTAALKLRGQFSVATALKTAANTWAIFGDLTI